MRFDTPKKFVAGLWLLLSILPISAGANTPSPGAFTWSCRVHESQTRVEFVLPSRVSYRYFSLTHPPRLVIDLAAAHWPYRPAGKTDGCGLVASVHWAERTHRILRYVLQLAHSASIRIVPSPARQGRAFRLSVQLGTLQKTGTRSVLKQTGTGGFHHLLQPFLQVGPSRGKIVIAIDPGHGGSDPGTHGPRHLDEKVVTLAIAKILARKIDRTPGLRAFLTRRHDRYVGLRQRVLEAQNHHAALFISIHANAYPQLPRVEGGAVYALSEHGASSAEAGLLARTENAADPSIGDVRFAPHNPQINSALTHMLQRAAITRGSELGKDVLRNLARYEPLYDHHVQYANFEVLRDPLIPSILIETAFLSNPTQARELHEYRFREDLAAAIYRGIREFLKHHNLSAGRMVHPPQH